jgi:hypothetical protein
MQLNEFESCYQHCVFTFCKREHPLLLHSQTRILCCSLLLAFISLFGTSGKCHGSCHASVPT